MQPAATNPSDPVTWWIAGTALLILLGTFAWLLHRSRRHTPDPLRTLDFESRILRAEQRATHAETAVKAGLLPHLARLLRARLVVGLLRQRSELISTQESGSERVAELEQRLATAQVGLQEKLSAYERELEELRQQGPPGRSIPQPSPNAAPPAATPLAPPRRNPLRQRPPRPEPEPLNFGQILARHDASRSSPPRKDSAPEEPPPAS